MKAISHTRGFFALVALSALVFTSQAQEQLKSVKVARSNDTGARTTTQRLGLVTSSFEVPILDPNPTTPKVLLSEGHKKTCKKRLGEELEDATIKDVHGKDINVKQQLSDGLTVLVFWSENSVAGYEQFRRLPVDVLARFAAYRVKVIAVHVGGTVGETRRLTGDADEMILSLADKDSKLFKQFATDFVPRTYILDSQGRIAWFDIEYSESTRRSLTNALTYFIKHGDTQGK